MPPEGPAKLRLFDDYHLRILATAPILAIVSFTLCCVSTCGDCVSVLRVEVICQQQRSTPDRRAAFRCLEVTVYLPVYEERRWAQLESVEEKNANNQTFTKSLRAIFKTINTWELSASLHNSQPGHTGLTLEVQAICKSEYWEVDCSVQQNRSLYFEYDVHMLRQENTHLQLLGELPLVLAVSELIIHDGAPRNHRGRYPRLISGDAASCIAAACPRLRSIEAELSDRESRLPTSRGSERSGM